MVNTQGIQRRLELDVRASERNKKLKREEVGTEEKELDR